MGGSEPGDCRIFWNVLFAALALLPTVSGCGSDTVTASGKVYIEGEPASGGRLSLNPIGEGLRAYSLVGEDGAFALHSGDGIAGAVPGKYRVTFRHQLEGQSRAAVQRDIAGEVDIEEIAVIYQNAKGRPFVIPDAGSDELTLDIRQKQGWDRFLSE